MFFQIVDPAPDSQAARGSGIAALVLCPGSLLFVVFIDAEPGTSGFALVWVMVALINAGLYGAVGIVIGRLAWARDN
jgi:hypothetical protein